MTNVTKKAHGFTTNAHEFVNDIASHVSFIDETLRYVKLIRKHVCKIKLVSDIVNHYQTTQGPSTIHFVHIHGLWDCLGGF